MDAGDMELASSLFGEMTDVEQQEAQNEYAAARSALDRMADGFKKLQVAPPNGGREVAR